MKFTSLLRAGLVSTGLLVSVSAQDPVKFEVPGVTTPAKAAPAPAPAPAQPKATPPAQKAAPAATPAATSATPGAPVKYTEAQLMEAYGYIFVLESGVASQMAAWEMPAPLREATVRGIAMALSGNNLPYDAEQIQAQLQEFLGRRQQAYLGKVRQAQLNAGVAHMTTLKANKNVIELPSGLRYEIVAAGKGAVPKPGQVVSVNYTGAFVNGQVFDTNSETGKPTDLLLQVATPQNPRGVIAGMFEGIQKTGVGGKLKLHIPPSLAYGDDGAGAVIPPGATLVFDIELVGVKEAPPAPPAK